eukprot:9381602-Alexandrium_andersonii.AAC.1
MVIRWLAPPPRQSNLQPPLCRPAAPHPCSRTGSPQRAAGGSNGLSVRVTLSLPWAGKPRPSIER